jgi:hypothetical protein
VLSFFPVVGIGTPPPPHPQASGSGGRGTIAGERGGGRVPVPARGHSPWYSVYISTLCIKLIRIKFVSYWQDPDSVGSRFEFSLTRVLVHSVNCPLNV